MKKIIATTKTTHVATAQPQPESVSVEKKMIEWHNDLFEHQIGIVNKMNPVTAFMTGIMTACGEMASQVAGLTSVRLMGDIGPYEYITKTTIICCNSEEERESLEGMVKLFQGLIDLGVCDSRITSTKEELEVVLKNL